ncbi:MAG: rod-binding protein [Fimbriimonadaceae bacterium]|nr:rod-binding protein [Fimbriimonadaceae bacterium]
MRLDAMLQVGEAVHMAAPEFAKLKRATQQIEAMFFKDMLATMGAGKADSSGGGFGADIYKDMFNQSLSETLSQRGSLGIGQMIYRPMGKALLGQQLMKLHLSGGAERIDRKE